MVAESKLTSPETVKAYGSDLLQFEAFLEGENGESKPLAEAGRVTIRILNNGAREAVLEIADNGLPLSEEGFAALSALRPSQKSEGLGLGLAIVRSILERHSGRLTFSRCETGGLIVCVYLPLAGGDADRDGVEQSKA